jgi:arsenate reductase
MITVLFACVHNAGRSQIAAALFNALVDPAKARGVSAGTRPAEHVHPEVVTVMRELGIELGAARPRFLSDELQAETDHLITMGCGEACPLVPGARREDWVIEDPKGKPIDRVREIRDEIRGRIERLIEQRGWGAGAGQSR